MQPLDREASTAAAATFAVGLAAGWLIHRHADDIKGAASKVSGVRFFLVVVERVGGGGGEGMGRGHPARAAGGGGGGGRRGRAPSTVSFSRESLFRPLSHSQPPPHTHIASLLLSPSPHQSISSAFGKLKAKLS
jgi:hypothetical protein